MTDPGIAVRPGVAIPRIVHAIEDMLRTKDVCLIGIDGCGGSGKSTLASRVAAELERSTVVHVDDFYSGHSEPTQDYHQSFDWLRLRDQVLVPLRREEVARYQRYDWPTDRLAEWNEVEPAGAVIVEGVYSTRPELRDYCDFRVFVHSSRETCLARCRSRAEHDDSLVLRWRAAEDWYLDTQRPQATADLIVSGEDST